MTTQELFAAPPGTAEAATQYETARQEAERSLASAKASRGAAVQAQAKLIGTQFKLNNQLAALNAELHALQPTVAAGIIDAINSASVKTDLVSAVRACTKKRQELTDAVSALNYALDHIVTHALPAAAVLVTEAKIAFALAAEAYLYAEALVKMNDLKIASRPLLAQDPTAQINLDETSLCSKYVQAITERALEAAHLETELNSRQQFARTASGGTNV